MRELGDGGDVVAGAVGGEFGVGYLEVDDAVYGELGVVAGDTHLAGHIQWDFFEQVLIGHAVEEGDEEVEAGVEHGMKAAEPLYHIGFLLRHDGEGFKAEYNDNGK